MHVKHRYVWQLLGMNTCTRGNIFPQNFCISPHNQTDVEQVSVEDSVSQILMQKLTVTSCKFLPPRCSSRIPRLQTALLTFYGDTNGGFVSGIRVTQGTIRRMWHSFNTAAKVSGAERSACPDAHLRSVTYSLHQLLLSQC